MSYNDWTNYETWLVKLWLGVSDQPDELRRTQAQERKTQMTYEEAIQAAEDAKLAALGVYAEMREVHKTIWAKASARRYEQLRQMAHSMSMRYADLRAEAMQIARIEREEAEQNAIDNGQFGAGV